MQFLVDVKIITLIVILMIINFYKTFLWEIFFHVWSYVSMGAGKHELELSNCNCKTVSGGGTAAEDGYHHWWCGERARHQPYHMQLRRYWSRLVRIQPSQLCGGNLPNDHVELNWQTPTMMATHTVVLKKQSLGIPNGGFESTFHVNETIDISIISPCTQEKADTRVILHCLHAAHTGSHKTACRTVDTDVVVLAISNFTALQFNQLWIHFCLVKMYAS